MAANHDGFEVSRHSGTPRAWLIFGCAVYGAFASILVASIFGMALDFVRGPEMVPSIPIAGAIASFGVFGAIMCLAKFRLLWGQLSATRKPAP